MQFVFNSRPMGLAAPRRHFRTDDGKTPNYKDLLDDICAFTSPTAGLKHGGALQQEIFIAIDEQTWLISEVRTVTKIGPHQHNVNQTQFSNWLQQSGQWFPGMIVRLENTKAS